MGAWFRAHTIGVLVGAVIVLVAIIGITLFVSSTAQKALPEITAVSYSQTQAGTNTTPTQVVVTDKVRIQALADLLTKDNIDPGVTNTLNGPAGCVGGVTSTVTVTYVDGKTATVTTYSCGQDNPEFTVELSALLAGWAQ